MLFEYVDEKDGSEKKQESIHVGSTYEEVMESVRKEKMAKMCPFTECRDDCKMRNSGICEPVRLAAQAPKKVTSSWRKSHFNEAGDIEGQKLGQDEPVVLDRGCFATGEVL